MGVAISDNEAGIRRFCGVLNLVGVVKPEMGVANLPRCTSDTSSGALVGVVIGVASLSGKLRGLTSLDCTVVDVRPTEAVASTETLLDISLIVSMLTLSLPASMSEAQSTAASSARPSFDTQEMTSLLAEISFPPSKQEVTLSAPPLDGLLLVGRGVATPPSAEATPGEFLLRELGAFTNLNMLSL